MAREGGFTAGEKAAEAKREVALRKAVYPGAVYRGELTEADARRQILLMEEIAADYIRLSGQGSLDL